MHPLALLIFASFFQCYHAYIPAVPTNSTEGMAGIAPNVTDVSFLDLHWYPNGSYSQFISYQLAGNGSQGVSEGALVHFSEDYANNFTSPTRTPWIALVSCDRNATNASMDVDIFTLARDRGARGALLYSLNYAACVINPEYADPQTFDQVFDIFSAQSQSMSNLIEYQFLQIGSTNKSLIPLYSDYDSARLNDSEHIIADSMQRHFATAPGYLFASLVAYNATNATDYKDKAANGPGTNSGSSGGEKRSNTATTMIVLYAITGCVSALFCIVIISGAVRAIRHPERYGPRARHPAGGGLVQTRAQGLTRAILDTFPVVKFGSANNPPPKDVETTSGGGGTRSPYEMSRRPSSDSSTPVAPSMVALDGSDMRDSPSNRASTSANVDTRRPPQDAIRTSREDVVPDAIGRETCPICIVDFEEGDDLRILPCEGKHRFHQRCVDPWLLELSSSCPICRHDFLALENMLAGEEAGEEEDEEEPHQQHVRTSTHHRGRFSRYVRSAISRHRRRGGEEEHTVPPVPTGTTTPP